MTTHDTDEINIRTDHSNEITALREYAEAHQPADPMLSDPWRLDEERDRLAATAIADLLEIHDATGLNLHQAPGILAFVQVVGAELMGVPRFEVDDNEV